MEREQGSKGIRVVMHSVEVTISVELLFGYWRSGTYDYDFV